MRRILITGMAGSGKSTLCNELDRLGYASFAIEDIDGMFNIYHKGTHNYFEGYSNLNPKDIENAEWLCDTKKLKELVDSQKTEIAFYCGVSSDIDELLPFFDEVVVLKADAVTLNERLKNREGTDNIGNNQSGRDIVLERKDAWEKDMEEKGSIFVNGNDSPELIIEEILDKLKIETLK